MKPFEYLALKDIPTKYPFTIAMLRRYLMIRGTNGLASCVRKVGNRIIIRRDLFEAWIESKGEK